MEVCPKCGHAWWKHDSTYFSGGCVGQNNATEKDGDCGCQMTKEQAERESHVR